MSVAIDHALRYAAQGMPVLPIWPALKFERGFTCGCGRGSRCAQPGKHPLAALVRNGLKSATTDEAVVRDWFTAWPDANVGIATGDVAVIDIDPRHGGDEALLGELPPTWRVRTGGGGTHLYFRAPPGVVIRNSVGQLGPGIDVRGQSGYVLAPPSNHVSGGVYAWEGDAELATMPARLVALVKAKRTRAAAPVEVWRALTRDGVAEGQRNDAAARLTGYLLRHWVDPFVVLELVQSWNITRCTPPLAPDEIAAVVDSVCSLELARRQAAS